MCLKIDAQLIRDYTISFFGGLVASLVIIFSLKGASTFYVKAFYFYLLVLYIIGLLITGFINNFINPKK